MKTAKTCFMILVCAMVLGCGEATQAQDSPADWRDGFFSNSHLFPGIDMNSAYNKMNNSIRKIENRTDEDLEYVLWKFSDGEFAMNENTDESILIAEGNLDYFSATTRHRNRFQEFYFIEKGRILSKDVEVEIPKILRDISQDLSGPDFMPAHIFMPLAEKVSDVFGDMNTSYLYTTHNTVITDILLEYNPHTPLVLLSGITEMARFYDASILCDGSRRKIEKHIRQRNEFFLSDLKKLMKLHKVHYVNLSYGVNFKDSFEEIGELCPGSTYQHKRKVVDTYLNELGDIFQVLHESAGVMSFQSSPYTSADAGPHDCAINYKNRLIVGGFNYLNAPIDADGGQKSDFDLQGVLQRGVCGDVYVNFNLDPRNHVDFPETLKSTFELGLGMTRMGRLSSVSTSNATPLALSRAIHLRHSNEFKNRDFDNDLIADLKTSMTPKKCGSYFSLNQKACKYIDPLLHRQAQVFKLGYW